MTTGQSLRLACPRCGRDIQLTTSAVLQSRQFGVSCHCSSCNHEWLWRIDEASTELGGPVHDLLQSDVAPIKGEPTVFVVDDDSAFRESMALLMESAGLRTQCFAAAEEFLGTSQQSRPGCLVLDLDMPGMGGLQLQQRLLSTGNTIPIIVLSGMGDQSFAVECLRNGALDYFDKPYDPEKLILRVRDAIQIDIEATASLAQPANTMKPTDRSKLTQR